MQLHKFWNEVFLRTQIYLSYKRQRATAIFSIRFESIKAKRQQQRQKVSRNINAIFVHETHLCGVYVAIAFFRFNLRHKNWFSAYISIQGHDSIILLK